MPKTPNSKKVTAVILTGGSGTRMKGFKYPKQFIEVLGKPIFIHTLKLYNQIKQVDEIILVINKKYEALYKKELAKCRIKKLVQIVPGGHKRQLSILNALNVVDHDGLIVIQNGINATTEQNTIVKCINMAKKKGAVTAFVPAFHTIFEVGKGRIKTNIPRSELGYTCEPQVCRVRHIKRALRGVTKKAAKDVPIVALLEKNKVPVHLVLSDMKNFKITIDSDLKAFEHILKRKNK